MVGEPHLVADDFAQRTVELGRDAASDAGRCDPARLGVADQSIAATAEGETYFRQLCRLAGPGLAADDDDLVRFDRMSDLFACTGNG